MLSYVNKFNHHCIESVVKMLPFETPTIFEQLPRFIFKMPRVVSDQKAKFESDELFRRLSRESEVNNKYAKNEYVKKKYIKDKCEE